MTEFELPWQVQVGARMAGPLFSTVVAQLKEPVISTESVHIWKALKHSINSSSSNAGNKSVLDFFIPSRHCPIVCPNLKWLSQWVMLLQHRLLSYQLQLLCED